jgi:hypothetical protein
VRDCCQKEQEEQRAPADSVDGLSEGEQHDDAAQAGRKQQRMGKPSVAEHVGVLDAESLANYIGIRRQGTADG